MESILLDQRGDLWVGTKNGLNLYSQQRMENFFHQMEDKYSLPNSRILQLEEDSLGNIWVGTTNGLAKYNREQKTFTTLTRGYVKSSLCIEGGVLFGGDNVLYFYDYQKQELERVHLHPEGPTTIPIEYRVQKIIPFKENKVLLGTRKKGLFIYDIRTREVVSFTAEFPNFLLFSVCAASDQYIYASFYGHGVYRFDQSGKIAGFYMTDNSPLNNNYVMDILEYDGKLWLATDGGGINLIDLKTKEFSLLNHITGDKTSLPSNSITELYKDYHDNLWAGSVFAGVFT
ncbi:MAG: AraC family transcriptional regulator, partial [Bacteroides sp.]|nr:AraC family transcriptional regulator [Bacteroides sp.]